MHQMIKPIKVIELNRPGKEFTFSEISVFPFLPKNTGKKSALKILMY